jgi:hypothetical protein
MGSIDAARLAGMNPATAGDRGARIFGVRIAYPAASVAAGILLYEKEAACPAQITWVLLPPTARMYLQRE